MSGFNVDNAENNQGFAGIGTSQISTPLLDILMAEAILPGSAPSYQLCKNIWAYHPLGDKIASGPINVAQSQERKITIPGGPEVRLKEAFDSEWRKLGGTGVSGNQIVKNLHTAKRVYGIASLIIGDRSGKIKPDQPLPVERILQMDLFFNILDPLNTAGSLVLDQNPNSSDFQRAKQVTVGGVRYHGSRALVVMHEQPIYIEFTTSAFGFVGRSVYQRALFPLKTFIQTMITDDYVAKKVGLLIAKMQTPGSTISQRALQLIGIKTGRLKSGVTGNVLTIGKEDSVESLNFQNLQGAGAFARTNCLKNIGSGVGMPAMMLDEETMARGMAEGSEDAKVIAKHIASVRMDLNPTYATLDMICQRKAWSPEFYESVRADLPSYQDVPYETAFYQWSNSFKAVWPNLLEEPESEKIKVEETKFKSVVALIEVMSPRMDPDNNATLLVWAADEINERDLFSQPLLLDEEKLAAYTPPEQQDVTKEPEPAPFSGRT